MGLAGALSYGYGSGYGSGSGSGSGYGSGYGSGSGSGSGYGSGDGSGSGSVVSASQLPQVKITVESFANLDACEDGLSDLTAAFPDGAKYPDDLDKARKLGLDVSWLAKLGLFVPEERTDNEEE